MTAFETLSAQLREIQLLSDTASCLGWDQETYLPPKGVAHRADQLAFLAGEIHSRATNKQFEETLQAAEAEGLAEQASNLREIRHHFDQSTQLPKALVEKDAQTSALAKASWSEAREKDDFQAFAPHLQSLVDLALEKANIWGYQDEPYTALLSNYERNSNTSEIADLFEKLGPELSSIAAEAVAHSKEQTLPSLNGEAPIEKQKILNREVAESLGFDFESGRIDTTTHPFCTTLGAQDVRLTTRYDESDFSSSLFGVLHEAGHGLYEQGLPSADAHLPSGKAVSLGIHESQSRLVENHVGRSLPFWEKWYPRAQELFPHLQAISLPDFMKAVNRANYTTIRVEADESTYDLHIILRFEIERALLNRELAVADLPAAWNEKFEKLFGFTPPNDVEGCLQDIHWSMGGIGYFPTYSLGNLNAAQLFVAAQQEDDIHSSFEKGDSTPLIAWMRKNVHAHGSCLFPQDLMQKATGQPTQGDAYLKHLRTRFLGS